MQSSGIQRNTLLSQCANCKREFDRNYQDPERVLNLQILSSAVSPSDSVFKLNVNEVDILASFSYVYQFPLLELQNLLSSNLKSEKERYLDDIHQQTRNSDSRKSEDDGPKVLKLALCTRCARLLVKMHRAHSEFEKLSHSESNIAKIQNLMKLKNIRLRDDSFQNVDAEDYNLQNPLANYHRNTEVEFPNIMQIVKTEGLEEESSECMHFDQNSFPIESSGMLDESVEVKVTETENGIRQNFRSRPTCGTLTSALHSSSPNVYNIVAGAEGEVEINSMNLNAADVDFYDQEESKLAQGSSRTREQRNKKRLRGRDSGRHLAYPKLEEQLYSWVISEHNAGREVTRKKINSMAANIFKQTNPMRVFGGGKSWSHRFVHRKNLSAIVTRGGRVKRVVPSTSQNVNKEATQNLVATVSQVSEKPALRLRSYPKLQEQLYSWIINEYQAHRMITQKSILIKAISMYNQINPTETFKGGRTWVHRFVHSRNLSAIVTSRVQRVYQNQDEERVKPETSGNSIMDILNTPDDDDDVDGCEDDVPFVGNG